MDTNQLKHLFISNQLDGLQREADEVVRKLRDEGFMAPELCQIAFFILEKYLEKAHYQIEMDEKLENILEKARTLLDKLKDR